ncbi:hypothetical protein P5F73_14090 [Clostridium perfringens]|nr:hypothetical protein [Clostridium perfringens]
MKDLNLELMEDQEDDNGCRGVSRSGKSNGRKSTLGGECLSTRTPLNKKNNSAK